jgi:outer membrane immunogenic protein
LETIAFRTVDAGGGKRMTILGCTSHMRFQADLEARMQHSKLVFSAAIALGAMAHIATASAADLAARPYTKAAPMVVALYDWSGFYIGGNGGYGSSDKCWTVPGLGNFSEGCHTATGGVAGGQLGYRWQRSAWVFGLEAQGDWANLSGSRPSLFIGTPPFSDRSRIDAFGLFTGQLGYSWNNLLLYVKGGAAVTSDKYDGLVTATGLAFDQAKEIRWGGSAGVGVEFGFTPNWSVAAEYDHLFMGTRSNDLLSTGVFQAAGTLSRTDAIRQSVDMVTARINYHFGGPIVARY